MAHAMVMVALQDSVIAETNPYPPGPLSLTKLEKGGAAVFLPSLRSGEGQGEG